MCSQSVKRFFSLILALFFCVPVCQVYGSCTDVSIEKTQKIWHSDLNIDSGDIYTVALGSDLQLGGTGWGIISKSNKINAIHRLDSGNFVLSSNSTMTVGDTKYQSGDLFEFDPVTGQSGLFFSGDLFDKKENIDAVFVRSNGNIVFSTKGDAELAGAGFGRGDIVEYNPATEQVNILMSGEVLGGNANVQALHLLDDGDILFSIYGPSKINDLKVSKGDIFRYDIQSSSITLAGNYDRVLHGKDVEGITAEIPEPGSVMFLMAGTLALLANRRKTT